MVLCDQSALLLKCEWKLPSIGSMSLKPTVDESWETAELFQHDGHLFGI